MNGCPMKSSRRLSWAFSGAQLRSASDGIVPGYCADEVAVEALPKQRLPAHVKGGTPCSSNWHLKAPAPGIAYNIPRCCAAASQALESYGDFNYARVRSF